ncbi:MAG: ferrochelatase, partial [Myxococcota bacterium]
DALLMSYHGVPERHIKKGDPSGCYCLKYEDCCNRAHPAQALCYRHHCTKTTELFAEAAGIPHHKVQMSFQSRLAGEPWLTPYTDQTLEKMPTQGKKRILVMCPAFVSDCLETLEEIAMEGHETFEEAGGKEFIYIPCLNDHPAWISVLERMVHDFAQAGEPALRSVSSSEGAAE